MSGLEHQEAQGVPSLTMAEIGSTLISVAEKAGMGLVITALGRNEVGPLYLSEAAVRILGRPREELMRGNLLDYIAQEDRARATDLVTRLLAQEATSPFFETAIVQGSGRRIPVEIIFVQVTRGDHVFTVNFLVDITARKELEEQVARSGRLAALGTLAARVGHEINNSLAFMTLNVEALSKLVSTKMPDPAARNDALPIISEIKLGTSRVASIVRDLRTLGQDEQGEEARVDVWDVIVSAQRLVRHRVGPRARMSIALSRIPLVYANAYRLEQVFVNILSNAAQAFDTVADTNLIRVRAGVAPSGAVFVEVEDNGVGIPEGVLGRIFDPFFTTRAIGAGTGLGLSIAHGIVARLGGELTVSSELGRGSTFRVVLPSAGDVTEGATLRPRRVEGRRRVLVVDDEPSIGSAIRSLLADEYDVDVETSGEVALGRLGAGAAYDAILCDVTMPDVDGPELYQRLSWLRPGVERTVAFMTGGALCENAQAFLARVPSVRLDKPFTSQALGEALRKVIGS